jgi:hypothetical protein
VKGYKKIKKLKIKKKKEKRREGQTRDLKMVHLNWISKNLMGTPIWVAFEVVLICCL